MELLPQLIVSGLITGTVYAVIAIGFSLVYNATTAINFAQGEFVMLGGTLAEHPAVRQAYLGGL
jgi:branched-chain amino acid transport system permease protein